MAGEQKRKARAAMVTKALLLGYTFEEDHIGGYNIVFPNGRTYRTTEHTSYGAEWRTPNWPAIHLAAKKALELSGVPHDEKKPSGDLGVGSGARYRLRGRQRLRGSAKRKP